MYGCSNRRRADGLDPPRPVPPPLPETAAERALLEAATQATNAGKHLLAATLAAHAAGFTATADDLTQHRHQIEQAADHLAGAYAAARRIRAQAIRTAPTIAPEETANP